MERKKDRVKGVGKKIMFVNSLIKNINDFLMEYEKTEDINAKKNSIIQAQYLLKTVKTSLISANEQMKVDNASSPYSKGIEKAVDVVKNTVVPESSDCLDDLRVTLCVLTDSAAAITREYAGFVKTAKKEVLV